MAANARSQQQQQQQQQEGVKPSTGSSVPATRALYGSVLSVPGQAENEETKKNIYSSLYL